MGILNLTKHPATDEQKADGVVDLPETATLFFTRNHLVNLLTFNHLPAAGVLYHRATVIAEKAHAAGYCKAMIDGPAFFMPVLERALIEWGFEVFYPFFEGEPLRWPEADGRIHAECKMRYVVLVRGGI